MLLRPHERPKTSIISWNTSRPWTCSRSRTSCRTRTSSWSTTSWRTRTCSWTTAGCRTRSVGWSWRLWNITWPCCHCSGVLKWPPAVGTITGWTSSSSFFFLCSKDVQDWELPTAPPPGCTAALSQSGETSASVTCSWNIRAYSAALFRVPDSAGSAVEGGA